MHRFTRAVRTVRDGTRNTTRRFTRWWRQHRDRVTDQHGYAEMLTEVILAAVELFVDSYRIRCLARAITSAYVWILRAFGPPPHQAWN